MNSSIQAALEGRAWSVSEAIFDLADCMDDEGRPVAERRASAQARVGVAMDMRECPYAGARQGRLINMSALAQISRHYTAVLEDMQAFRREAALPQPQWLDVLAAALDQLARPALYLLEQRSLAQPVPAQAAVSHKLAAGFFDVLRKIQVRLTQGEELALGAANFMRVVDEENALIGASEVCAGSLPMIRRAALTLVEGAGDGAGSAVVSPARVAIARCLALQVHLGTLWERHDRASLWQLVGDGRAARLRPSNSYLARKLEASIAPLQPASVPVIQPALLRNGLEEGAAAALAQALRHQAPAAELEADRETALQLLREGQGVIGFEGEPALLAQQVAQYLLTYRLLIAQQTRLELRLRGLLGFDAQVPVRLGAMILPRPLALPWYEFILGRRVDAQGRLQGSSLGLRTPATPNIEASPGTHAA